MVELVLDAVVENLEIGAVHRDGDRPPEAAVRADDAVGDVEDGLPGLPAGIGSRYVKVIEAARAQRFEPVAVSEADLRIGREGAARSPHAPIRVRDRDRGHLLEGILQPLEEPVQVGVGSGVVPVGRAQALVDLVHHEAMRLEHLDGVLVQHADRGGGAGRGFARDGTVVLPSRKREQRRGQQHGNEEKRAAGLEELRWGRARRERSGHAASLLWRLRPAPIAEYSTPRGSSHAERACRPRAPRFEPNALSRDPRKGKNT